MTGRSTEAIAAFERAIDLAARFDLDYDALISANGLTYIHGLQLNDPEQAERWGRAGLASAERIFAPRYQANLLATLAQVAMEQGNSGLARERAQWALELEQHESGRSGRDVGMKMAMLASACFRDHDLDAAQAFAEEAVGLVAEALGPDAMQTLEARNILAQVALERGEYARALTIFRELDAIARHHQGDDGPYVAVSEANTGIALSSLQRCDEAVPLLQRALGRFDAVAEDPRR